MKINNDFNKGILAGIAICFLFSTISDLIIKIIMVLSQN